MRRLLVWLGAALTIAAGCGKDSTGPTATRIAYCVDSVYYHFEQPSSQYTRDWIRTTQNTFTILLVGDTTGTFETSGSVQGLIQAGTPSDVDTVAVQFVNGATTGSWIAINGRMYFAFRSGYEPFLGDPEVHHSAPTNNKFTSVWEYSDANNNEGTLKVWWKNCK